MTFTAVYILRKGRAASATRPMTRYRDESRRLYRRAFRGLHGGLGFGQ